VAVVRYWEDKHIRRTMFLTSYCSSTVRGAD
jgi:hypothetical protein